MIKSIEEVQPLTPREEEVCTLIARDGLSNKEAARILGISPRTIEDHRANIMKKLDVRNAVELILKVNGLGKYHAEEAHIA